MKVILEHDEILDAIAEYAARKLNVKPSDVTIRLNARKGRKFDADIEMVEYVKTDDKPLTDDVLEEEHY